MAEPDGAVEVQGTVAVHGTVAKRDPDMIVAEIERTRQNLAQTIDELAEKVSPANNIRKLRERVAAETAKPEVRLAVAAAGLIVMGYTIYRIWGRRRA
jgi:hypothetical protein